MKNWTDVLTSPTALIIDVIKIIDCSSLQIALVVDENNRLLGTVTDGDIRRGLLQGVSLNDPVHLIMNRKPTVASIHEPRDSLLATMKSHQFLHIPIVDKNGCVVNLEVLNELISSSKRENWVVLMVGGSGTRLHPLTQDCPKPLLKVGDKPILETIVQSFIEYGFHQFYFAVNYKASMIENYFGDGSSRGIVIKYLHEKKSLGTAGALSLLPEKPTCPVIVMNGDLLTKVNFKHFLEFHLEHCSKATMAIREYKVQVPYGVVKIKKHRLKAIVEKPVQRFFVSAGVYVLDPDILDLIAPDAYLDMPTLFEQLIRQKHDTAVFPIREYWLDIGRMGDYERANGEYAEVFR